MKRYLFNSGWMLRLAWHDLKGGRRAFWGMLSCMILAVAAVTCLSQINWSIQKSLQNNSRTLLGGDFQFTMSHKPLDQRGLLYLASKGRVTQGVRLRAMATSLKGRNLLVELKAVDQHYPLLGRLSLLGGVKLQDALSPDNGVYGAAADEAMAAQLGIKTGDSFMILGVLFRLKALIRSEPDRELAELALGPRVMISQKGLLATGMLSPHSLPKYTYTVLLKHPQEMDDIVYRLRRAYARQKAEINTHLDAVDFLSQPLEWIVLVLMLLSSATVLVAGLGIGFGVRIHLDAKNRLLSVLRSLGCSLGEVFLVFFIQVGFVALAGCLLGAALGCVGTIFITDHIADQTGLALQAHWWTPRILAGPAMGLGTALIFSLRPLWCASRISVAQLIRGKVDAAGRQQEKLFWGLAAAAAGLLQLAIIWTFLGKALVILIFAVVAAALAVEFYVMGRLLFGLFKKLPAFQNPVISHAFMKIQQPGGNALSLVMCLGLAVSMLSGILMVETSLQEFLNRRVLKESPAFFFLGLQPHQVKEFQQTTRQLDGVKQVRTEPSLLAKITAVNRDPVVDYTWNTVIDTYMEQARPISHAGAQPPGASLSEGGWWPADYRGKPLISVDAWMARLLGITVGDTLTLRMSRSELTATIANLRRFDWRSLRLYHPVIINSYAVRNEPGTYMAEVFVERKQETELLSLVSAYFPKVQGISPRMAMAEFNKRLSALGDALGMAAMLFLICTLLMLWQAVKMSLKTRSYENALWKVLGATRADLSMTLVVEYGLISVFAVGLGSFSGWGLANAINSLLLDNPEVFGLATIGTIGGLCILVSLLLCLGQSIKIYHLNIRKLFGEL